ncbi:hypothetical protein MMON44395_05335 [Mycolicibacterium monacense DSM 44395]|nr:hypothetical protein [Mycolicibacterium monacense DSM 44395]
MMNTASAMLQSNPKDVGRFDRAELAACIELLTECSHACNACADACLSEESVADLTKCIRTDLDCADVCDATRGVLARHTGNDDTLTMAMLAACVTACRSCADECSRHADHHEHCRVCADVCRRCEVSCRGLADAPG